VICTRYFIRRSPSALMSALAQDPQIHSVDGTGFGKGNMGKRGIDKFLSTHRCNAICAFVAVLPCRAC
jgi:hypothetical protein